MQKERNRNFGATIRRLRTEKDISLRELARKTGITPAFISKMEQGKSSPPKAENIEKIAQLLHMDADDLLELADRIDHHSTEILKKRRKLMRNFLYTANKLSDESLMYYQKEMEEHTT